MEEKGHEYLVKAKLTAKIQSVLLEQKWDNINSYTAVCEFEYNAHGWQKARKMYAVRIEKCRNIIFTLSNGYIWQTKSRLQPKKTKKTEKTGKTTKKNNLTGKTTLCKEK